MVHSGYAPDRSTKNLSRHRADLPDLRVSLRPPGLRRQGLLFPRVLLGQSAWPAQPVGRPDRQDLPSLWNGVLRTPFSQSGAVLLADLLYGTRESNSSRSCERDDRGRDGMACWTSRWRRHRRPGTTGPSGWRHSSAQHRQHLPSTVGEGPGGDRMWDDCQSQAVQGTPPPRVLLADVRGEGPGSVAADAPLADRQGRTRRRSDCWRVVSQGLSQCRSTTEDHAHHLTQEG